MEQNVAQHNVMFATCGGVPRGGWARWLRPAASEHGMEQEFCAAHVCNVWGSATRGPVKLAEAGCKLVCCAGMRCIVVRRPGCWPTCARVDAQHWRAGTRPDALTDTFDLMYVSLPTPTCRAIAVLGVDFMSENVRAILDEAGHKDVAVYRMAAGALGGPGTSWLAQGLLLCELMGCCVCVSRFVLLSRELVGPCHTTWSPTSGSKCVQSCCHACRWSVLVHAGGGSKHKLHVLRGSLFVVSPCGRVH